MNMMHIALLSIAPWFGLALLFIKRRGEASFFYLPLLLNILAFVFVRFVFSKEAGYYTLVVINLVLYLSIVIFSMTRSARKGLE